MKIHLTSLLLALSVSASVPSMADDEEVAIYPGFTKSELPKSVREVVAAAERCARAGKTSVVPQTSAAIAPHLSAQLVDGLAVALQERSVDLACGTKPVRRCSYTYVWAAGSDQIGHASIQCLGSHEDAYTSYLVTAAVDLRGAKKPAVRGTKKDKALVLTSLTFQTDAFPGSHVTAFVAMRRRDGATDTPPQVMQFDDYAVQDEASGALTSDEMAELAQAVLSLSCRATRTCGERDLRFELDGSDALDGTAAGM